MRNLTFLCALLTVLCVAPAGADQGPAETPDVDRQTALAETVTPDAVPNEAALPDAPEATEADFDELFTLDPSRDTESKYVCMTGCTVDRDCEMQQEPPSCGYARVCMDANGACTGTCVCC